MSNPQQPSRSNRERVQDILDAAQRIKKHIGNMSYSDFCNDDKTIDAVIRQLEVAGEAAQQLPESFTQQYNHIPFRAMADSRNILIHQYHNTIIKIVWQNATESLPQILDPLEQLHQELLDQELTQE